MSCMVRRWLPVLILLFGVSLFVPANAWASSVDTQDGAIVTMQDDGHAEDTTDEHATEDEHSDPQPVLISAEEGSNVGLGVTLGILGLVLAIIFVVAVVGAAGLGIIGLGAWQASGED